MKRIFAAIALLVIFGGGFYYYSDYKKSLQDPLGRYEKIVKLPEGKQVAAYQKTVSAWIKDPVSQIPYPKGWRKVSVSTQGYTYEVVTPDENNPPQYYVAFAFPKKLIPKMNLIKCLGILNKEKTTDICMVGDSPVINAYFTIVGWLKNFSNNQIQSAEAMSPNLSI